MLLKTLHFRISSCIWIILCQKTFPAIATVGQEDYEDEPITKIPLPISLVDYESRFSAKNQRDGGSRSQVTLQDFPKANGNDIGKECDFDLHKDYVNPIYQADDKDAYYKAVQHFLEKLKNDTALVNKSCFTITDKKPRHLECDANTKKCKCNTQEPYKSILQTNIKECVVEKSAIGTPCRKARSEYLRKTLYFGFRKKFNGATVPSHYKEAENLFVNAWAKYTDLESLESDIRRACFNYDQEKKNFNVENLECSASGECQCVSTDLTRFQYESKSVKGVNKCVAKDSAICTLKLTSGWTLSDTTCSDPGKACETVKKKPKKMGLTLCGSKAVKNTHTMVIVLMPFILTAVFI